jgi:V/A-type H+/Na+-transporting ATPase subunit D
VARSLSFTRLGLKRQREELARYQRFLPALKRKQQQLRLALQETRLARGELGRRRAAAAASVAVYESVLGDLAGVDVRGLAVPAAVASTEDNVAGVKVPAFGDVRFPVAAYSLFATGPWVDRTLADLRTLARLDAELQVLGRRERVLAQEAERVVQRVNLFEKVKIPQAEAAMRRIRIHLGDQMSADVGRAKLAKRRGEAGAARGRGTAS